MKELLSKQRHHIEKHSQFFRESNEKFEKRILKTFHLDKIQHHLDKREETFFIQDFNLLNLLNSLNSDQENFMIQCSFDFVHSVSIISLLMMTIYFVKSLLISD